MATLTREEVHAEAERIANAFADGFDLADLFVVARGVLDVAAALPGATNEERKSVAVAVGEEAIDRGPSSVWFPSAILKALLPYLIEFALDHSKGRTRS